MALKNKGSRPLKRDARTEDEGPPAPSVERLPVPKSDPPPKKASLVVPKVQVATEERVRRESGVRAKHEEVPASATVDEVTADLRKDARRED